MTIYVRWLLEKLRVGTCYLLLTLVTLVNFSSYSGKLPTLDLLQLVDPASRDLSDYPMVFQPVGRYAGAVFGTCLELWGERMGSEPRQGPGNPAQGF